MNRSRRLRMPPPNLQPRPSILERNADAYFTWPTEQERPRLPDAAVEPCRVCCLPRTERGAASDDGSRFVHEGHARDPGGEWPAEADSSLRHLVCRNAQAAAAGTDVRA